MYLSDLRVYFRVTWSGGVLKPQKKLVDYANTTNVEFIVDPKVLFHGSLIYSYLHLSCSSDCHGRVQIGSLSSLWHDHIAFIDDTACRGRKTACAEPWTCPCKIPARCSYYLRAGSPVPVEAAQFRVNTVNFLLPRKMCFFFKKLDIERFHSRDQHLCKFIGTIGSIYIRKRFISHRTPTWTLFQICSIESDVKVITLPNHSWRR